ncbi:2TM domain-containing protein [Sediminibacterium goheungense]|uniref:2TM domain-containing protein n=1 Tax=Sediminibacterium goheungense TaxID=1086393 RepID=A0A4R6IVP4_9BACT|nr:2TM domain-containing protein [Sediminibacterium goheungense]TDO26743.1 2TM domain-containing protein [Sediminibacterium goheungense]
MNNEQRDEQLWQIAKARASFKWGLLSYFVVNAFLVLIWFFSPSENGRHHYFWPIWPILGWGVGLAFHYFSAYHGNKFLTAADEYEKLKNKKG